MSKQETDMGLFIVIAIVLMAILLPIFLKIKNWFLQTFNEISIFVSNSIKYIQTHGIIVCFWVLLGLIVIYIIYKRIKVIKNKIKIKKEERKSEEERLDKETKETEKVLDENLDMNFQELSEFILLIKERLKVCRTSSELSHFIEPLKEKLKKSENSLEELRHEERVTDL